MKFKVFSIIALAVMAIVLINSQLGAQAENMPAMQSTGVVVCDVEQVLKRYSKTLTVMAEMEEFEKNNREKEAEKRKNIDAIRSELKDLNPDSDVYIKRQEDYERAIIDLKIFLETNDLRLSRMHTGKTIEMVNEIRMVAQQIAQARGFSIVLNTAFQFDPSSSKDIVMNPKVLFASNELNITQDVINVLNNNISTGN